MGDKKIYIVAKIFDQQGCLAYLCKTPNEGPLPSRNAGSAEGGWGADRYSGFSRNLF